MKKIKKEKNEVGIICIFEDFIIFGMLIKLLGYGNVGFDDDMESVRGWVWGF